MNRFHTMNGAKKGISHSLVHAQSVEYTMLVSRLREASHEYTCWAPEFGVPHGPRCKECVSASSQRSLYHKVTHDGYALCALSSLKYTHLWPHQPDPVNMSTPPSIRVTGESLQPRLRCYLSLILSIQPSPSLRNQPNGPNA